MGMMVKKVILIIAKVIFFLHKKYRYHRKNINMNYFSVIMKSKNVKMNDYFMNL